ncbi:7-cyano-7-deazaguanine synthase QueC [Litorivicinus lipolyticus]|uniref:7-cyano-7-deazaguanine synthase n=2 Tax=Litorivicinus lipolyticus TaxID=418701 RepID=A0A5Q2QDA8_9GAMM|nr:7-cyano-7-deazaguanine synthase QueC [Litorivicinus lipolyticus]
MGRGARSLMVDTSKKAVILLSGGLDSATVLAMAQADGYDCYTLGFDYGQRHDSELRAALRVVAAQGTHEHKVIRLNLDAIGGSALTDGDIQVPEEATSDGEIPVTYVPARNTVFLSIALGYAEVIGANHLFIGANAVDYSGYPDCRPEFIQAFERLANVATKAGVEGAGIHIHAPLMTMTKGDIVTVGTALGVDYGLTITCYQADDHGGACGRCEACRLRKAGFEDAGIADPTKYS